jgi:microcystin-dependent protein
MGVKLSNNASSRLSGSITNSATSLAVEDASAFPALSPGEWFPATIVDSLANREIVKVTARSGATFTIERAQEGTAARAFNAGSRVDLRATSAALGALVSDAVSDEATARDEAIAVETDARETAISEEATARQAADNVRVKFLGAGAALPTSDIGPIWHADYADIMVWQAFTANGASYTGYASVNIGKPSTEILSAPRAGYIKRNGASLSNTTYAALWNWAKHNGLVVALGSWAAGTNNFADNGDGTFKLPDVRGEHVRLADDGRGVDSGRTVGSFQNGQVVAHTHGVTDPGHSHPVQKTGNPTQRLTYEGTSAPNAVNGYGFSDTVVTGITIQSTGGTENRVRNTAELAVIKF